MMKNLLTIAILLVASLCMPLSLQAADREGHTMEYDLYLPQNNDMEVTSILHRIDDFKSQIRHHADLRDEAINYFHQVRKPDNRSYWFFEAIKQDARCVLMQIRLVRLAHSLQPKPSQDTRSQQWRTSHPQENLQGLRRSVDYVRGLLIKAGEDTVRLDLLEQNLVNHIKADELNSKLVTQSRLVTNRKKARFQRLADEYIRIRRQFIDFITKESIT